MKNTILALMFTAISCAPAFSQERNKVRSEESLFLDLQKIGLGSLSEFEEKKKFFETVKLEKQKLQATMLDSIYENAFEYYRCGNYEDAKDLAARILAIDPGHSDAQMLLEASNQLRGSLRPAMSKKLMLEDRFRTALSLYTEGRILEAYRKMQEVVKLSPNNIKAKYWHKKLKDDLKDYYFQRGVDQYKARELKDSLDNLYNALLIRPRDAVIVEWITRIEDELRQQQANDQLKRSLELYAQGKLKEAYEGLRSALEIQPGDSKANKLLVEVKGEIADGYTNAGKTLYGKRKYNEAISEWGKARPYSSNPGYLDKLVIRAREQMRREAAEKRRRSEEAARRAREEEARRIKEAEEQQKAEEEAARRGVTVEEITKKPERGISAESRLQSQQHYLEGLKYFQNSNYEKARSEWTVARQLDPENADAASGLKRIQQILAGGQ